MAESLRRTPDYRLKLKQRHGTGKTDAGVAWQRLDGSIAIALNPGIVLSAADDLLINLFKYNDYSKGAKNGDADETQGPGDAGAGESKGPAADGRPRVPEGFKEEHPELDDDIPF